MLEPWDEDDLLARVKEPDDEKTTWYEWILLPFILLWEFRYYGFWLLVAIGAGLAALGVFDKDKIADSRSCPGYGLVRNLKTKGQIETFSAVEPEGGWDCEYSLDNEDAEIRFRTHNGEVSAEVEGYVSSGAYVAAGREMEAKGFKDTP